MSVATLAGIATNILCAAPKIAGLMEAAISVMRAVEDVRDAPSGEQKRLMVTEALRTAVKVAKLNDQDQASFERIIDDIDSLVNTFIRAGIVEKIRQKRRACCARFWKWGKKPAALPVAPPAADHSSV